VATAPHQEMPMNDATSPGAMGNKPKRENYQTDDDFGEAYALWRSQQDRVAQAAPVAKRPSQVARASLVAPVPANPLASRRSEAEREAWNLSTKARFWRAKTSASGNKAK